jgi:hypothetical protein
LRAIDIGNNWRALDISIHRRARTGNVNYTVILVCNYRKRGRRRQKWWVCVREFFTWRPWGRGQVRQLPQIPTSSASSTSKSDSPIIYCFIRLILEDWWELVYCFRVLCCCEEGGRERWHYNPVSITLLITLFIHVLKMVTLESSLSWNVSSFQIIY